MPSLFLVAGVVSGFLRQSKHESLNVSLKETNEQDSVPSSGADDSNYGDSGAKKPYAGNCGLETGKIVVRGDDWKSDGDEDGGDGGRGVVTRVLTDGLVEVQWDANPYHTELYFGGYDAKCDVKPATFQGQCVNWEEINKAIDVNQVGTWDSTKLVDWVGGTGKHKDNQKINDVPGLENFQEIWLRNVNSHESCEKYRNVEFEVDVYVEISQAERSEKWHRHPQPLILNCLPVRKNEEVLGTPVILTQDGIEKSAGTQNLVPLSPGVIHRERSDPTNRIFMVISPLAKRTLIFRGKRAEVRKEYGESPLDRKGYEKFDSIGGKQGAWLVRNNDDLYKMWWLN